MEPKNVCRWLYFVGFMDMLSVSMIIPLILLEIKSHGASHIMTGIVGSTYGCLQFFSSPLIGSWSDSKGKKYVLCVCLIMSALGYLISGVANSLLAIIVSRIIVGIFKHTHSLGRAYLADITPENKEGKVFGEFMATSNMGFVIGPVIGGHLATNANGFFLVCSATSVIFILSLAIVHLKIPDVESKSKKKQDKINLKSIFNHLFEVDWKEQYDLMLGRFFFSFAVLIYRSNFSLIMTENFDFNPKSIGYIISYQGIISACSGFLVGKIEKFYNHDRYKILKHSIILLTISLLGLTISGSLLVLIFMLTLLCISTSVIRVQFMELSIHRCKKDEVGAVIGIAQSTTSISRMFSPLVAGIAQEVGPYGPGVMGSASAMVGYIVTVIIPSYLRSKKN